MIFKSMEIMPFGFSYLADVLMQAHKNFFHGCEWGITSVFLAICKAGFVSRLVCLASANNSMGSVGKVMQT